MDFTEKIIFRAMTNWCVIYSGRYGDDDDDDDGVRDSDSELSNG